jgi:hypothetical protein
MPRDTLNSIFDAIPTNVGRMSVKTIVLLPLCPLIWLGLRMDGSDCQQSAYHMLAWWKR